MALTLKLEIATPEGTVYSEDVELVTLPAIEGQMGVYPQHIRLMTKLVPGELIVHKCGQDDFLAVGEGLVDVTGDRVSIVTDMAVPAEKIDEAKAEQERQRADAQLRSQLAAQDLATVNASFARSLAQLSVKRRSRKI
jgi:F-type H+-transporting ATPase subunit epsilon